MGQQEQHTRPAYIRTYAAKKQKKKKQPQKRKKKKKKKEWEEENIGAPKAKGRRKEKVVTLEKSRRTVVQ